MAPVSWGNIERYVESAWRILFGRDGPWHIDVGVYENVGLCSIRVSRVSSERRAFQATLQREYCVREDGSHYVAEIVRDLVIRVLEYQGSNPSLADRQSWYMPSALDDPQSRMYDSDDSLRAGLITAAQPLYRQEILRRGRNGAERTRQARESIARATTPDRQRVDAALQAGAVDFTGQGKDTPVVPFAAIGKSDTDLLVASQDERFGGIELEIAPRHHTAADDRGLDGDPRPRKIELD